MLLVLRSGLCKIRPTADKITTARNVFNLPTMPSDVSITLFPSVKKGCIINFPESVLIREQKELKLGCHGQDGFSNLNRGLAYRPRGNKQLLVPSGTITHKLSKFVSMRNT